MIIIVMIHQRKQCVGRLQLFIQQLSLPYNGWLMFQLPWLSLARAAVNKRLNRSVPAVKQAGVCPSSALHLQSACGSRRMEGDPAEGLGEAGRVGEATELPSQPEELLSPATVSL
jgi:hypothetical protein